MELYKKKKRVLQDLLTKYTAKEKILSRLQRAVAYFYNGNKNVCRGAVWG